MKLGILMVVLLVLVQVPAALPGNGLAQHPFLYCGEWDLLHPEETMSIVRGGKVVWSYAIPDSQEYGDCTLMSNGNIVFSRKTGASEITPEKKALRDWDPFGPASSTQLLDEPGVPEKGEQQR